ncbi:MAG TPA: ArdC-like ssDNA-binding domain-containing protein [Tepidisphaeraceae bacterium]|mgnify:CR=1 FL=1|nr:ArdC-like ssDNA-binding domain-containing protein [Tepidisphaeraceae bacterium]
MSSRSQRSASVVPKPDPPSFAELLEEVVHKPGVISHAYFHFHSYSMLNQLLAFFECKRRVIQPGPIHTFKGWLALNRHVRKGEKGITLCMPISWKERRDSDQPPAEHVEDQKSVITPAIIRRRFIYRANWFVLAQTDGEPLPDSSVPQWNESLALNTLSIERIPFDLMNGNAQGFARGNQVSVSPIAYLPLRTLMHEIAHVLLGHTAEGASMIDQNERTPRDVREVEAEAVAYIVTQSLNMPGEEFSRGYLQHWLQNGQIEERSAQKIFHAADVLLKAGRPANTEGTETIDSAD